MYPTKSTDIHLSTLDVSHVIIHLLEEILPEKDSFLEKHEWYKPALDLGADDVGQGKCAS